MPPTARISTPAEVATSPTIVVPVTFDEGIGHVADCVPATLGEHSIPRQLSVEWCTRQQMKADAGSVAVLRALEGPNVAFVSVGTESSVAENYRLAGAAAMRCCGQQSVTFLLPTEALGAAREVAQALVEGALLASYSYKSDGPELSFDVVPLGTPLPSVEAHDAVTDGVARGVIVADAVNWAKRLIDSPGGDMAPRELARQVEVRLEHDEFVTVESWNEPRIKEERLGGLLGVGAGSAEPTRLVYATYDPRPGEALAHIALVGKGVTFDSGGLSLKPPTSMEAMKTDMSGAAIVMAALSIASRLRLAVRLTVIAPMTENLPGDRAIKPGDVLTIRNGTTIEVLNTDAEGRLILADGLCLAAEAKPDVIVDIATLTGAQRVALGDELGALFANTDELASLFNDASRRSGEGFWRMPLHEGYTSHIESDVADVKNTGKTGTAGTIAAALILRRFTDGRPWVHLDIAAPGRAESARGYITKGATAYGTRTIVEFLEAVSTRPLTTTD